MRGIHRLSALTITLLAVLLASACDSSEPAAPKATAKEILSGAESGEAATGMDPCALLSDAQVAEVLPGAKAGMNTHSGGSLIDGVDAYQCTWINDSADMLTVILNVARNAERFADIRPGDAVRDNRQPVDAGAEGWMRVASDEVKVKAVQGYSVIDVELLATDAADRSAQMIGLARIVASRLE